MHAKENWTCILFAMALAVGCMGKHGFFKFSLVKVAKADSFTEYAMEVAPKFGVTKKEVKVLMDKESKGFGMKAIRFEPHYMKRSLKVTKNRDQARMLASSHCRLQIMGHLAHSYGVEWNELYNPQTCAELGIAYFAKQKERCRKKGKSGRKLVHCAAKYYNGSTKYADDFVRRLEM